MSLSRYAAAALLNSLFGKTSSLGALASAPTLYVALLTATPADTSTGSTITEAAYTGYARVATAASDWNTAAAGSPSSLTNLNAINFPACTAGTSICTCFALVDAISGGNVIAFGALTSNYVAAAGNTPSFAAGQLSTTRSDPMPFRKSPFTICYTAFNRASGLYVPGDAANHALQLVRDGILSTPANLPADIGEGQYTLTLTGAETDCGSLTLRGQSSTGGVEIVPSSVAFDYAYAATATSGPSPSPVPPTFRYIPVMGSPGASVVRLVRVDGLATVAGDAASDGGTLYLSVAGYAVTCYADMDRAHAVLSGSAGEVGAPFALTALNGSGLSAAAILESIGTDETDAVALVSLAADADVQLDSAQCAAMPGYDPTYGLAFLHAQAQRDILCTHLPARVPHLFPGKAGLSQFTPGQRGAVSIPDLRLIAGAGQLREAQAALVKARSFQQQEHLEEAREVASAAAARFMDIMQGLAEANVLNTEAGITEDANWGDTVSTTSFRRG